MFSLFAHSSTIFCILGVKMVGDVGSPGNYYIPDHTLAQLTVKELNKRVSQVSQPSLLLTVVLLIV